MVRPAGFEPATCRLGNDCSGAVSVDGQELTTAPPRPSADSPAVEKLEAAARCDTVRPEPSDGELERVASAWATLPPPLKAAILTIVDAAGTDRRDS